MTERRGIRGFARTTLGLLGETLSRCVRHSVDTHSAALAFYSLFALAPVLLVIVSIARRFFAEGQVRGEIVRRFQAFMGPDAGLAVAALLEKAAGPGTGAGRVGVVAILAFVFGATAVTIQLQDAMNRVWETSPRPTSVFRLVLVKRLVSFALVLVVGFLLLVSLALSAGLMALTDLLTTEIPLRVALLTLGNEVLSFLVLALLIALVYRVLPDVSLRWRDVGLGAAATSLLFSIGKWLIGFYLGRTSAASQFGVPGSLVVVLVWVYYESTILLFGAELTAVYSIRYRQRPVPPEAGATRAGEHAARELE